MIAEETERKDTMVQLAESRTEAAAAWKVDPAHATVEFAVKHLMIATVKGRFRAVEATLHGAAGDPLSTAAEAVIDVASVDTGNADRDAHLRSADFFDVERYPTIRYVSRSVRRIDEDEFEEEDHGGLFGVEVELVVDVQHLDQRHVEGLALDVEEQDLTKFSIIVDRQILVLSRLALCGYQEGPQEKNARQNEDSWHTPPTSLRAMRSLR